MKIISFIVILITIFFYACAKKVEVVELKYTNEEFEQLAHAAKVMKPMGENAIHFADYSLGVSKDESNTLIYERIKFFAVKFENEKQARAEAIRLNQYYSRNMLFDRVEGEPVLEDYVITTFKAENPNRTVQRIPKSSGHGDAHGAPAAHGAPDAHAAPAHH